MRLSKHFICSAVFALSLCAAQSQAATITTNIFDDPPIAGADPADCSVRYAIESLNTAALVGGCQNSGGGFGSDDTVILVEGDYLLQTGGDDDNNQGGDLDVLVDMTITGAGSGLTSIVASGLSAPDRVLHLLSDGNLEGLTLTGGDSGGGDGGGLLIDDFDAQLEDIVIAGNVGGGGGGLFAVDATVFMNNSTVDDNECGSCGGGISVLFSTLAISNSTISNNDSTDSDGGGICSQGSELFLTNSTISTNTAVDDGGGVFINDNINQGGTVSGLKGAYNVTIVLNEANLGGGIASTEEPEPAGGGGNIPARVFNSIIAKNTATSGTGMDCANGDFRTGGFNLIGQISPNDNCFNFVDGASGDQVGISGSPIDPMVGNLVNNGGPTLTHALLTGSSAIDRGNPDGCQAMDVLAFLEDSNNVIFNDLTTDQRGLTRPVAVLNPNDPICDIGAYELQVTAPTPTPTPTATPVPPFRGFVEGSGCSLNAAPANAAAGSLFWGLGLLAGFLGLRKFRPRA